MTETATAPRFTAAECPSKDGTWVIKDANWDGATVIRSAAHKVTETLAWVERVKS